MKIINIIIVLAIVTITEVSDTNHATSLCLEKALEWLHVKNTTNEITANPIENSDGDNGNKANDINVIIDINAVLAFPNLKCI